METFDEKLWPVGWQIFELSLIVLGLAAIVHWQFRRSAAPFKQPRLPLWPISLGDFLIVAFLVVFGGLVAQLIAMQVKAHREMLVTADTWLVIQSAAFQIGMLTGALIGLAKVAPAIRAWEPDTPTEPPPPPASPPPAPLKINPVVGGLITFLAALPLVHGVAFYWTQLLDWAGVAREQQPLVDLFNHPDSRFVPIGLSVLAVMLAPITEEMVFRAGLFRYLRTRVPRFAAYVVSACTFSALHGNLAAFAPLVIFGLVVATAYERTGRISVSIAAHAFFNLHTLVLLAAGLV